MKAVHHREDIHLQIFTSISDCRVLWEEVAPGDNLFLQYDYLSIVETYPPAGITFRYAVVFKGEEPLGVVYTQIVYFNGAESIRYHRQMESPPLFSKRLDRISKVWWRDKSGSTPLFVAILCCLVNMDSHLQIQP